VTDDPDPNAFEKRYHAQMEREIAEANTPQARAQAALDRWWESQRDLEAELNDTYTVGGFLERWSQTPSYTKSRRDRDWRVR
jgi:hypothetical protein